ncbi:MAG: sigma-54-dependent Fis family transcriptional regulator, partial [Cephaloticoccus sp.]|nr:sigma-54-dependent Fis family transcriptional regulator [Cephaloticoccus sp.]
NIRELRNFCENGVVLHRGGSLSEYDREAKFRGIGGAPASAGGAEGPAPNPLSMLENEKRVLHEALIKSRGNRTKAAALMGISRRTLHRKLTQFPELDVID